MGSSFISGDTQSLPHHVVLFPFMSKGHTIPILHLAHLHLHCRLTVTIFTTSANYPFIFEPLNDTTVTTLDLPFAHNVPDIPVCIESTDKLPLMSMFRSFTKATKLMQPDFERALQTQPCVSFILWRVPLVDLRVCFRVQHPEVCILWYELLLYICGQSCGPR